MDAIGEHTLCPVCGYDLGFPAWSDGSPSDEICPSCGIQFGYDDAIGLREPEGQSAVYARWRGRWLAWGAPWSSRGQAPPVHWDPVRQLQTIETGQNTSPDP